MSTDFITCRFDPHEDGYLYLDKKRLVLFTADERDAYVAAYEKARSPVLSVAVPLLIVVAAVVGWVGVDTLFVEHADASLAGVWAFLITAPASLLFVMLPGALAWAGIVVGAVVNAAVLGAAYHKLSGRRLHPTA